MRKQILESLKTKFEGVSDTILNRIAEKLAKTTNNEDDVATSVEGVTFQQIIDSESDRRATEATQTAVLNYEKKHSLKEGKPATGGEQVKQIEPTNGNDTDIPEWAKPLIDNHKRLTEEVNTMKGDKVIVNRKQQLSKIIDPLPLNLRKPYMRLDLGSMTDEGFSALAAELEKEVGDIGADIHAKGAVFGIPKNGEAADKNNKPAEKEAENVAKAMGL